MLKVKNIAEHLGETSVCVSINIGSQGRTNVTIIFSKNAFSVGNAIIGTVSLQWKVFCGSGQTIGATRWFILDGGVLAYYKSQEEVNQGCKGSLKVSACEIIVNPVDSTRMDLVIPGEQHIYLRAATSQERQQWLVALGSAKACVTTRNRKDSDSNPDTLKSKKSELRLYCDLLMQQVHMVKTSALQEGGPETQKLDEATSLLGATCDTFIRTLEDCMKLANANFTYELPHQHVTDTALPPVSNQSKGKIVKATVPVMRTNSVDKKT